MAKKASKTAAKRKTATRKKVATAAVTPSYLAAGKSVRIGLHDVILAIKMIEAHGHLRKLVTRAKSKKVQPYMLAPADTVNFVKDFVVEHGMHEAPIGSHIVGGTGQPVAPAATRGFRGVAAASGDPNRCRFGSGR